MIARRGGRIRQQCCARVLHPLGLQQRARGRAAELAHGSIDRRHEGASLGGDRAGAWSQLACKESVERIVGERVGLQYLVHVDLRVRPQHRAQDEVAHGRLPAACQRMHAAREQMLRENPLQQGEQLVAARALARIRHRCICSKYCTTLRKSRAGRWHRAAATNRRRARPWVRLRRVRRRGPSCSRRRAAAP